MEGCSRGGGKVNHTDEWNRLWPVGSRMIWTGRGEPVEVVTRYPAASGRVCVSIDREDTGPIARLADLIPMPI